jgi:hypothetical protein
MGLSLASRKLHLRAHHSHLAPAHSFGVTCTSRGRGQCRRPRARFQRSLLLLLRSRAAASPRALGSRSVAVQAAVAALVVFLVGGHLYAAAAGSAGGAGGEGRRSTRARALGGGVSPRRCAHLALLARRRYGAAELRVLRAVVRAVLAAAALARLALGVLLGAAGHCGGERGAAGREGRRWRHDVR